MSINDVYVYLENIGVSEETPEWEARIVRTQNKLCIASALILSSFPFFFFMLKLKSGMPLIFVALSIIIGNFFFNALQWYRTSRMFGIIGGASLFILGMHFYGLNVGFEFGLMAILVLPILYFKKVVERFLIYVLIVPIVLLSMYYLMYNPPIFETVHEKQVYVRIYMFLSCLSLVVTYFLASESINKDYEHRNKKLVSSLIQRNHELESFSYLASHDLKQPIRTILNFTELMQLKGDDKLDSQSKTFLNMISNSGKRLNLIVDSILKYNVIGVDRDLNIVDCNEIVQGIIDDLNVLILEKGALIRFMNLPKLIGDQAELSSLFQNLISNALKFSDSDRTPFVDIRCKLVNNHWIFSIADNGQGFDVEYVDKIFQLFQRLDNNVKGTGIGLAHCKKIVELNGGKIWAESEEGKGSTFYFSILRPNKNLLRELSSGNSKSKSIKLRTKESKKLIGSDLIL